MLDSAVPTPTEVDFHFDVMCPWAYQTSKWIRDVRAQNGLTINWKFFSLEEVNRREGKKHPWEREWSYGWSMMRIGAVLRRSSMDDLDRWYERAGRALHEEGFKPHEPDVARHLLEELDLDPGVVDEAIADETTHDVIKQEHGRVIAAGGYGVPTLFFPEFRNADGDPECFFGPVVLDPPTDVARVPLPLRTAAAEERRARRAHRRDVQALRRGSRLDLDRPRQGRRARLTGSTDHRP
jgi:2-hydroxychromene-2-carboxylate isomerase